MKPWVADIDVDESLVVHVIGDQFPSLAPISIRTIGEGWDNLAFVVNDQYVFRLPRRRLGVQLIRNEMAVLDSIARRLPLPIPRPKFIGEPCVEFPYPFFGYAFLRGTTACRMNLSNGERDGIADQLAELLVALHSISSDEAFAMGAVEDELRRVDPSHRVPRTRERLRKCHELGLIDSADAFEPIIRSAADLSESERASVPRALTHGDLYVRHLLLDDDRRLCGIIDWGDVHAGSIATDLSIAYLVLPPESHDRFFHTYGQVNHATIALAKLRALNHTSSVAEFAIENDDQDLLRECRYSLGNLVR